MRGVVLVKLSTPATSTAILALAARTSSTVASVPAKCWRIWCVPRPASAGDELSPHLWAQLLANLAVPSGLLQFVNGHISPTCRPPLTKHRAAPSTHDIAPQGSLLCIPSCCCPSDLCQTLCRAALTAPLLLGNLTTRQKQRCTCPSSTSAPMVPASLTFLRCHWAQQRTVVGTDQCQGTARPDVETLKVLPRRLQAS